MNRNEARTLLRSNSGVAHARAALNTIADAAQGTLDKGAQRLGHAQAAVVERGREAVTATDDYVHEHPWRLVGIATVLGIVVGLWIARR